ncbi:MAG: ribosome recycling factor [Xanthomonadales bacterium]|nr:ribosome recycling factor [Xanthomonadales bacterium]
MLDDIMQDAEKRMQQSVEHLRHELTKVRTGRAHTSLLDHLRVDYYGNEVPISQAATVSVSDARTLTVQPWEKTMVSAIEKSILESDLGLNPNTAGTTIRIVLPPLTEERRRELTKVVGHEGEHAKVAIRNVRRDAIHHTKELLKEKEITEDQERKAETDIQQITDKYVAQVDEVVKAKDDELMEI